MFQKSLEKVLKMSLFRKKDIDLRKSIKIIY